MLNKIYAPFTVEQVEMLNDWQISFNVHPYTCPNRGESLHGENERDQGVLNVSQDGLKCQDCGYLQLWAFDYKIPKSFFQQPII